MNIDDRLLRRAGSGQASARSNPGQTQAADARPNLQKAPSGNPIAIPLLRATGDVEHERVPCQKLSGRSEWKGIGVPTTARALTTYDASTTIRYAGRSKISNSVYMFSGGKKAREFL